MSLKNCLEKNELLLMEGAISERLKREYRITLDPDVTMTRLADCDEGRKALKSLWREYLHIAEAFGVPYLALTPTRRANRDRMEKAGCPQSLLCKHVALLRTVQEESRTPMFVGGLLGSYEDAFSAKGGLSEMEAFAYHSWQAEGLMAEKPDFLMAGLMPELPETIGMAKVLAGTGLPYLISFTLRRDGRLIDGTSLSDAIKRIDDAAENAPLCYMTNCIHPSLVKEALLQSFNQTETVRRRFLGIQGNASPLDYDQLDQSPELKTSAPNDYAQSMLELKKCSSIRIFGGCCGTDGRHLTETMRLLTQVVRHGK